MTEHNFSGIYTLLAILFIALNAFYVAAEFAFVKIRVTRLELLAKGGNRIAKFAFPMIHKQLDAYLSVCQLGITLTSLGLGWIGEPAFSKIVIKLMAFLDLSLSPSALHSISVTIAFLLISGLHIVLGELVPKSIAIRTAEKVTLLVAVPMKISYYFFFPLMWTLNGLSNQILKLMKIPLAHEGAHTHSEEELKLIVEDSYEEGKLGAEKKSLLDKAIDFSHKTVEAIMIPEKQVTCMTLDKSISQNLDQAKIATHTRFPLREKKDGKVIGFVHIKDVIWSLDHGEFINLFDLKRNILFFPPKTTLDFALRMFKKKKVHMAIVQNHGGPMLGILTLEDVIEELVGEIEDEFDQ